MDGRGILGENLVIGSSAAFTDSVGSVFQGANARTFGSGVTTLYTISTAPPEGTMRVMSFPNPPGFHYVRQVSPPNGFCNVSEQLFFSARQSVADGPGPAAAAGTSPRR